MKIQITEPVFFLGQDRQPGDVLEAEVGPYRYEPGAGGLKRTAQFVRLPEPVKVETNQMTDPLPTVNLNPAKEPATSGITGAGHATLTLKEILADGKSAIAGAHQHVMEQAGKLKKAAGALQGLGDDIGSEADDLLAAIGQFKNDIGL